MTRARRIYILIINVNKLFSFFSSCCFLKEIENMFSVFLSSYRNTRESFGELEKAVETLAYGSYSHSISLSPKLPLVFQWLDRNTVHVFYFLNKINIPKYAVNKVFFVCSYWLRPSISFLFSNSFFTAGKQTIHRCFLKTTGVIFFHGYSKSP